MIFIGTGLCVIMLFFTHSHLFCLGLFLFPFSFLPLPLLDLLSHSQMFMALTARLIFLSICVGAPIHANLPRSDLMYHRASL
ncbi:hypothetical protein FPQ18DRAFT_343613 [Pyronema domesticum]|nr:hypothetical protein FPQ18DRAFT_343613 [Pyronema domesticum]